MLLEKVMPKADCVIFFHQLIYKGPDVSCEQPIPEIKAVGKELKSDDKITIRDFSSQSLKPRLRKQEKTTLTKALAAG